MIQVEDWWNILIRFNETIMPFQFIWAAIALALTIWFLIRPGKITNFALKIYFMLSFALIAIVFFAILGQELPAFIGQIICFGSLAILFAVDLKLNEFQFTVPKKLANRIIMYISIALVFLYPIVGMIAGHNYPQMIIIGTFPCPTIALALVFATASLPNVNWSWKSLGLLATWILMLIWAIPFPIAIQLPQFGAYEDVIMLLLGLYGLVRLVWSFILKYKEKRMNKAMMQTQEIVPEV